MPIADSILSNLILLFSLIIPFVYIGERYRIKYFFLYTLLIFLYQIGVSVALGANRELLDVVFQSVFNLKIFFILSAFYLALRPNDPSAQRVLFFLFWFMVAGAALNIALGSVFFKVFNIEENYRGEALLPRLVGFFMQPNKLAYVAGFFFLYFWFMRNHSLTRTVALGLTFVLILLSGSRSTLIVVPIVIFTSIVFSSRISRGLKVATLATTMIVFALGVFIFKDSWLVSSLVKNVELSASDANDHYIRGLMLYNSFVLAYQNFPFGSGVATFGTVFSEASPVYTSLGMSHLPHVREMRGIFDSNFASVLGELGLVGIIVFYGLLWYLALKFYHKFQSANSAKPYTMSLFCFVVVISLKGGVFMDSFVSAMLALFLVGPPHIQFLKAKQRRVQ
ncbi:O-antigen ligase family protein [Kangiella koreensis]|uniref:O-antigen ligase family protein n=1 Tax=Kangiella koreensis TaxID=261964 RepID=UPI0016514570|nr:O-antigen ligase family protein [Kangiella koreensis]